MTHSRRWKEAHLHSCLFPLLHKVAPIKYTNRCAYNKHAVRVPAVLDMRAIRTWSLTWSSFPAGGGVEDEGTGEYRDGEWWGQHEGNERELVVVGLKGEAGFSPQTRSTEQRLTTVAVRLNVCDQLQPVNGVMTKLKVCKKHKGPRQKGL